MARQKTIKVRAITGRRTRAKKITPPYWNWNIMIFGAALAGIAISSAAHPKQFTKKITTVPQIAEQVAPPVRLVVPALNIDTAIDPVGVTPDGAMDVAHSYTEVGWYKYGPQPGEAGNAVIEGHLDTETSPQAIFYNLSSLKAGDTVTVVEADGKRITFSVTASVLYAYNEAPTAVFGAASESHLNLVTCGGTWIKNKKTYDQRLVVFTKRI